MAERYRDYAEYLGEIFDGKIQKLAVTLPGATCPNRDGRLGHGGCTYCNNASFAPAYTLEGDDVATQLVRGRDFFSRKYPMMRYLAYFQAYTSTYGDEGRLLDACRTALGSDGVEGLVIATRPDCVSSGLLDTLGVMKRECHTYICVEYGAESLHDSTLRRINRCHDSAATLTAIRQTLEAGLHVGAHLIMGLPGEDELMMTDSVRRITAAGVNTLKLHHLQVLRGSVMAQQHESGTLDIMQWSAEEYAALCVRLLRHASPYTAIERFTSQAPPQMVVTPRWGLKNHEFTHLVTRLLDRLDARQGDMFVRKPD